MSAEESTAEKLMQTFGARLQIEELLNEDDDSHLPLILTANAAIFAVSCAILIATSENGLTATRLLILVSAIFSLITIPLNIWYLVRIKVRMRKLRKEQEKIFQKTKQNIVKTLELFSGVIKLAVKQKAELCKLQSNSKEEFSSMLDQIGQDKEELELIKDKGYFIFQNLVALSIYETMDNFEKALNSPLDERGAALKLFVDRISDRLKNWGLVINCVLIVCALLVITIVG